MGIGDWGMENEEWGKSTKTKTQTQKNKNKKTI